jgi:hypothetical protein
MPLTRRFKKTVQGRVRNDPAFREALLREGVPCLIAGDVDAGKRILRDDINATVGFDTLGRAVDTPPKSLMRMFGPRGQLNARNLLAVIDPLQRDAGIELKVEARPRGPGLDRGFVGSVRL